LFSLCRPAGDGDFNSESGSKSASTLTQNNFAADLKDGRQFANPGQVSFGPLINYFGQPLPSEGFQPIEQIIMYSCWFTEGALESMLKGVEDVSAEFKVSNLRVADAKLAAEDGKTKWIKVVISRDKYEAIGDIGFKGFITARSEDRDTTMVETMAKAALTAVENGCNVIHFTAQGAVRDVEASGWGIGFNTTQASLAGGGNGSSNVTSGGFGYSQGTAGTRDKPWLQGFGLVDSGIQYPTLDIPVVVTEDKVTINEKPAKTEAHQIVADVKPQTGNHTSYGSVKSE